jgi:hypothetical protein
MRHLLSVLAIAASLSACDSQLTQEEFEQTVPALELSVEAVGTSNPVRDSLRVRVTGLNTTELLRPGLAWIDGERVEIEWSRVDPRTVYVSADVSELSGTHTFLIEASDYVVEGAGPDSLVAGRTATATFRPVIERTITPRLVTGTSAYESDVSDVFHDPRGALWVRISDYRSSFWSSPDGTSFTRRRYGFERFIGSEGDTAWIEYTPESQQGTFLARVDLATGQSVASYQVVNNGRLLTGASYGGEFYGIYQDRQNLVHVRDGAVRFLTDGPYAYRSSAFTLRDYHVSPDGVHWLATTDRGVLRNDGAGWASTSGLPSTTAFWVSGGPGGTVWSAVEDATRCMVGEWVGGRWDLRATFGRDGNGDCGVFAVGATGGVWRGTTDAWIVRSKGGVVDRRYPSEAVTAIDIVGRKVWVGTGYGLREVLDHEGP